MLSRFLSALVLGGTLVVVACATVSSGTNGGVDLAAMDTSVRPGADFYNYANGNWQRTTEIPADRSSIGAFYEAFLTTERQTRELVDGIVQSTPQPGTDAARIRNFYNAYVNTAAIDAAGMAPIQADL